MSYGSDLASAVGRTVAQLSPGALESLVAGLRDGHVPAGLPDAVATSQYRDAVGALVETWIKHAGGVPADALAFALECSAERQREAAKQTLSIVWTGPSTDAVPVRRTDQALLELIRGARRRLIIVSFAVYKVPELAEALAAAACRGVSLAVILESPTESGGKVAFDMTAALGVEGATEMTFYTWPAERRPLTSSGKSASLHAKCAVADGRRLLVSSANLTEFALSHNVEIGLLVRGGGVPDRVQDHLEELITRGEFAVAPVDKA